jgi:hypothetical protein
VIEVAHHPPRDRLELGKHPPEQTAVVHLGQPRVEAAPRLQQPQQRGAVVDTREEVVSAIAIDVLLDAGQRLLRHFGVRVDRGLEGANPRRRVAGGLDRIEEAHAVTRQTQVGPHRYGCGLPRPVEGTRNDARVPEIVAHQSFDALARLGAGIAEHLRRPFLHLVTQHVLIPIGADVQRRPEFQEKVLRVLEPRRVGRAFAQQQRIRQHRDRARGGEVAQGARRLLDVGLELIQRRVEPRVPLADQLQQRSQYVRVRRRRVKQRVEPIEQVPCAGNQASVQQRQQELGVVGLQPRKVVDLADLVADDDPEVPQRMEERAEKSLARRLDPLEQHQQIDVGVQRQMPSSVPAQRHHRHAVGGFAIGIQLAQQHVHTIRVALERRAAAGPIRHFGLQLRAGRIEAGRDRRMRAGLGEGHVLRLPRLPHQAYLRADAGRDVGHGSLSDGARRHAPPPRNRRPRRRRRPDPPYTAPQDGVNPPRSKPTLSS